MIPTVEENRMADEITKVLLDNWLGCTTASNRWVKIKNIVLGKIIELNRQPIEERYKKD